MLKILAAINSDWSNALRTCSEGPLEYGIDLLPSGIHPHLDAIGLRFVCGAVITFGDRRLTLEGSALPDWPQRE